MHFKMSKNAQSFFADIISPAGSHGSDNKSKFKFQFDVYYCCALIGMAATQLDEDASELNDLTESYPKPYVDCKAQIAGLLFWLQPRLSVKESICKVLNLKK